jgi:hypothetical protein
MHQCFNRCKLILQDFRRRKNDDAKKTCVCIVAEKNHQAQDCLIKASTLKLYKVQNVSTNIQSKVEDVESENKDVQP